MGIGTLYYSQNYSDRGETEFQSMPFYDGSITHNRDKASSMTFKSNVKLEEADRIIYKDISNNTTFGGQVIKRNKSLDGDYSYEIMDYTRLYQTKVTCHYKSYSSSGILKDLIGTDQNRLSTAGIQDTGFIHSYVKWENTSLWDIIAQLAWLEYQAGVHIYYDVDYTGTLIWKEIPETVEGYSFSQAYDYNDSHDSSGIITRGVYANANDINKRVEAFADDEMLAKWGVVTEVGTCTPPQANNKNKCKTKTVTTQTYWTKCGVSPDKKLVIGIGKPSAGGDASRWSYAKMWKAVFENKCPACGKNSLIWAWHWGNGKVPCKGTHEGGSAEGHIFCSNGRCDKDFSAISGRDHLPNNVRLKQVSKTVQSSLKEANLLKKGKLPYEKKQTTSKKCKKTKKNNKDAPVKSLKNEANIKKYNISSIVWKTALQVTSPKQSQYNNAKAIFSFMAKNIPYEGYGNSKYGAAGTLRHRRGNCCDHAHLFAAMCRSIGLKCNYIHNPCASGRGWQGHVYNKVYINGKGIIVDTGRGSPSWGNCLRSGGYCPREKERIDF